MPSSGVLSLSFAPPQGQVLSATATLIDASGQGETSEFSADFLQAQPTTANATTQTTANATSSTVAMNQPDPFTAIVTPADAVPEIVIEAAKSGKKTKPAKVVEPTGKVVFLVGGKVIKAAPVEVVKGVAEARAKLKFRQSGTEMVVCEYVPDRKAAKGGYTESVAVTSVVVTSASVKKAKGHASHPGETKAKSIPSGPTPLRHASAR